MKSLTFSLTLKRFSNAYKGKPYFRGGLENRSRKSASKPAISVPIKILRFAFTGLLVMLQNVIINQIQISIHFEEGLLVFPEELIIDRISSHTRGRYAD